jgi:beta-glucosidase
MHSIQKATNLRTDKMTVPMRAFMGAACLLLASTMTLAQSVPVVTGDARVDKLLSQMTLNEKLTLIHGTHEDPAVYQGQAGYMAGIPRLGIPGLRFADGPPGVLTRHPSQGETATMGVAATFSRKSAEDNGLVIGREDRALGMDVSLQPFVNIDRDLEFGRGYNTFGEDPFLTSEIGAAEIKGIQSQHVMAQVTTPLAPAPTSMTRRCTRSMSPRSTQPSRPASRRSCAPTTA